MKKIAYIFSFSFFVTPLLGSLLFSQNLIWEKSFNFGGNTDHGYHILEDTLGNFFLSGYKNGETIQSIKSAVAKLNSDGNLLWKIEDQTQQKVSRSLFNTLTMQSNLLFWVSFLSDTNHAPLDSGILSCVSTDGNILWQKSNLPNLLRIAKWRDKLLLVQSYNNSPTCFILDTNGNIVNSFQIGEGIRFLRVMTFGDAMYLFATEHSANNAFVSKFLLPSGNLIWRRKTNYISICGAIDNSGCVYFGGSSQSKTTWELSYRLTKYTPDGDTLWDKTWSVWSTPDSNFYNWGESVAVSTEKNAVVFLGETFKKGSEIGMNVLSAYMKVFNLETGEPVSEKIWDWAPGDRDISVLTHGIFTKSQDLIVLGYLVNNYGSGVPPGKIYVQKWRIDKIVSVNDNPPNPPNPPVEFSLSQNYPNPFNPVTNIKYQIPKSSYVTLKVFDVLGREIATLVDEEKLAGEYEIRLTTNDLRLTSGVYFYQLKAGNYIETQKMVFQK